MAGRPIALRGFTSWLDLGAPPAPLVNWRAGARARGAARSARSLPRQIAECLRMALRMAHRRGAPLELPAQPERRDPAVAEATAAVGDMGHIASQVTRYRQGRDGTGVTVPALATATPPVDSGASMSASRAMAGLPACPPRHAHCPPGHAPCPALVRPSAFRPQVLRPARRPSGRGSVSHRRGSIPDGRWSMPYP
jgi:hypothetical protein